MRPTVGISTYRERARWGTWDAPAVLLPVQYADAVAAAGGEPVLLPTGATSAAVLERLDALVLSGGADVDPARYGQQAGPHVPAVRPDRDAAELALLTAAREAGRPVLAICRGMQLLNVAMGGDLVQHLPERPGAACHDPGPGRFQERQVRVSAGSRLGGVLGTSAVAHCHHHQSLDRLAPGLTTTAWAEDGTVEGVETEDATFCLGVQWHPEVSADGRLFQALVAAARD